MKELFIELSYNSNFFNEARFIYQDIPKQPLPKPDVEFHPEEVEPVVVTQKDLEAAAKRKGNEKVNKGKLKKPTINELIAKLKTVHAEYQAASDKQIEALGKTAEAYGKAAEAYQKYHEGGRKKKK